MKNTFFLSLLVLLAAFAGCDNNDEDPCDACPTIATCVDGECVLPPNTYYIGGIHVTGHNPYVGILQSDLCPQMDSILLDVQPNDEFELYAAQPGAPNPRKIGAGLLEKFSDSTYRLFTINPFCYYAYMDATIHTDSINLRFEFWELSNPEVILDTAHVTLYKQWP